MDGGPFISRLADRLRWPIALTGVASALIAVADLLTGIADRVTVYAACAVGLCAVIVFVCAVFDMRFQRAVSVLNAERRAEARRRGWLSRLTGVGLPMGDPLLLSVSSLLLIVTLVAGNLVHHGPAAMLGFAGFSLVGMAQAALMTRGYPKDRFVPPLR
jgi:hypothetical protein